MKTTAIIVAAGSGSRFNSETPKQFVEIAGKPVVVYAIERFAAAPAVDDLIVVVASEHVARLGGVHISKPLRVVTGGVTRAESVFKGLAAVESDVGVVAVHDGARPFVTDDEIERTIAKAKEMGAACLVGPVTDTIKTVHGDEILGTLDRSKLRRALTPQAFKVEVLRRAFEIGGVTESVTDECYLVEKLGHPIEFVEGSSRNIKITHPEDLILAAAIAGSFA
ncbi:MAG TPA: 2-C-methyl-D-erythritol 4-phosphate cytidylyltransferase [Pyrinomonadaceae bacterium]|nr:2-C-methyl-D-erythritol 4-phosphate cytidylyltransferase [Pyrinomonadaceae bacterium]